MHWMSARYKGYESVRTHRPPDLEDVGEQCKESLEVKSRLRRYSHHALNLAALVVLVVLGVMAVERTRRCDCSSGSDADWLRRVSSYSPLFTRVDMEMVHKRMNSTLLPSREDEIYRAAPSPEVDKAWLKISNESPIAITKEEVIQLGKDPSTRVKYPPSFGLGEEVYAGRLDIFHQIHCLDALRREAYWDHYYGKKYESYEATPKLHKAHLSHCIYYLLQNIMCSASLDVYTHVWTDALNTPFPDFNMTKKCRNFDALLDYQERNAVKLNDFYAMRRPEEYGAPLTFSESFKDLWREFNSYNEEGDAHHGDHIG